MPLANPFYFIIIKELMNFNPRFNPIPMGPSKPNTDVRPLELNILLAYLSTFNEASNTVFSIIRPFLTRTKVWSKQTEMSFPDLSSFGDISYNLQNFLVVSSAIVVNSLFDSFSKSIDSSLSVYYFAII